MRGWLLALLLACASCEWEMVECRRMCAPARADSYEGQKKRCLCVPCADGDRLCWDSRTLGPVDPGIHDVPPHDEHGGR